MTTEEFQKSKIIERCDGIDIGKRFLLRSVWWRAHLVRTRQMKHGALIPMFAIQNKSAHSYKEEDITHVVMESTGFYRIPVSLS